MNETFPFLIIASFSKYIIIFFQNTGETYALKYDTVQKFLVELLKCGSRMILRLLNPKRIRQTEPKGMIATRRKTRDI